MGLSHSSECVHYMQQLRAGVPLMNLAKGDGDCYQQLQNLMFHIGGELKDDATLQTGALLGGEAGTITIKGNNDHLEQGNSSSSASASLQNLLFHIGGELKDDATLQTGALLGGEAGTITIKGDYNHFEQGNSSATSDAKLVLMLI